MLELEVIWPLLHGISQNLHLFRKKRMNISPNKAFGIKILI
jgi:hypothetical protein